MRVKSLASIKHRKIRKLTKGFRHSARRRITAGKEALMHAGHYAYVGRHLRKRDMRALWIVRLSAAVKLAGTNYSSFIGGMKKANVELDRKVLSEIAVKDPSSFEKIVKFITQ